MKSKERTLSVEDVFFVNLDEDLSVFIHSSGFDFELAPMSLYEEASMAMYVLKIARELLENPEYAPLIESLEYPDLKPSGDLDLVPIDLTKMAHIKYVISYLPSSFGNLVDNVAFFNKVVRGITKNGQRIAVRNPNNAERPIVIYTFLDFIKYIKGKNIHLQQILEELYKQYTDWETNTSVDPIEVKN